MTSHPQEEERPPRASLAPPPPAAGPAYRLSRRSHPSNHGSCTACAEDTKCHRSVQGRVAHSCRRSVEGRAPHSRGCRRPLANSLRPEGREWLWAAHRAGPLAPQRTARRCRPRRRCRRLRHRRRQGRALPPLWPGPQSRSVQCCLPRPSRLWWASTPSSMRGAGSVAAPRMRASRPDVCARRSSHPRARAGGCTLGERHSE